jgi:hypothetical protein
LWTVILNLQVIGNLFQITSIRDRKPSSQFLKKRALLRERSNRQNSLKSRNILIFQMLIVYNANQKMELMKSVVFLEVIENET